MKEKLLNAARAILSRTRIYLSKTNVMAKHPVGTAVIAGIAGSMATYALEKTHREQELSKTKSALKASKGKVNALRGKVDALKEDMDSIRNRDQTLLIALREADKYGSRTRADLEGCRRQFDFIRFAHLNSWCFF